MGSIPPDINPHLGLAGSSYGTVGHRIQEQAVRWTAPLAPISSAMCPWPPWCG